MSKPTFFNLPDDKRGQILKVTINEFADNDHASASITRIVARAAIAKGSFYRYFADIETWYAYLLLRIVVDGDVLPAIPQPDFERPEIHHLLFIKTVDIPEHGLGRAADG